MLAGLRLHRGRERGLRAGLQARGRPLAQHTDEHPERHARHLHSVRPDEGESSQLDADDHEAPRERGGGEVARPPLGSPRHQGPQGHIAVDTTAAARRGRGQSLVAVLVRSIPLGLPVEGPQARRRLPLRLVERGAHGVGQTTR